MRPTISLARILAPPPDCLECLLTAFNCYQPQFALLGNVRNCLYPPGWLWGLESHLWQQLTGGNALTPLPEPCFSLSAPPLFVQMAKIGPLPNDACNNLLHASSRERLRLEVAPRLSMWRRWLKEPAWDLEPNAGKGSGAVIAINVLTALSFGFHTDKIEIIFELNTLCSFCEDEL